MDNAAKLSEHTPVILVGMHRSGTSLVARILHECGIFMGQRRSVHDEAYFFMELNHRLFRLAHAEWDYPLPVQSLLQTSSERERIIQDLTKRLLSWRSIGFTGTPKWGCTGIAQIDHPWGWKDPRTAFTLPFWMDIFPKAKLVHLIRNGVDVAASLWKREQERHRKNTAPLALADGNRYSSLKTITRQSGLRDAPVASYRCLDLEGAFSLWNEYSEQSTDALGQYPAAQIFELRYEDLLHNPKAYLAELLAFLEQSVQESVKDKILSEIKQTNAYRFLDDEYLTVFYQNHHLNPMMIRYGYDQVTSQADIVIHSLGE